MLTEDDVRRIAREELDHAGLRGMPDFGGFNSDHDERYRRNHDHLRLRPGDYIYLGNEDTDGTVRIGNTDGELMVHVREDGSYV